MSYRPVWLDRAAIVAGLLAASLLFRAFHQLESGRLFTLPRPLRRGIAISLLLSPTTGLPIDQPPVTVAPPTAWVEGIE